MQWAGSSRSSRLPPDWEENYRQPVLQRDGWLCQIGLVGCLTEASEVDHIHRGDDHAHRNLRAVCSWCHGKKSSAEGHAAKRKLRAQRKRPAERHPGRR